MLRGDCQRCQTARGIAVRPGLLVFFRWEVGGEPFLPRRATIQVEMTGDREAVAFYVSGD